MGQYGSFKDRNNLDLWFPPQDGATGVPNVTYATRLGSHSIRQFCVNSWNGSDFFVYHFSYNLSEHVQYVMPLLYISLGHLTFAVDVLVRTFAAVDGI